MSEDAVRIFTSFERPEIRGNEWKYVKECLDSNWVSSAGPFVERFEAMMARYVGAKYGVATVNGTTALQIALLVSGVQPEEEVLVSALTFIAPANAIRYVGAWPVFIDADANYWQMDPGRVVEFLEKECQWRKGGLYNKKSRRRVKAILPVHILGHPCDMDPIIEAARKYDLVVIEDAAESLGAKYKERLVGHVGDIACLSFNGNKIITTGGGGMIITDNEKWADRAQHLTTQAKADPVEYVHDEIGYNYRLSNIQAAIGCAQMEKLDEYIAIKRRIASLYAEECSPIFGITCMKEASWAFSVFWIFTILMDETSYGMGSRDLLNCLRASGIETRPLWQPLHQSLVFHGSYVSGGAVAEQVAATALSLPSSVGLKPADQHRVVSQVTAWAKKTRGE